MQPLYRTNRCCFNHPPWFQKRKRIALLSDSHILSLYFASRLQSAAQPAVRSDLCAVCIAYAYLDWLAGEYGDATLEEVLALTKDLLKDHLPGVSYR